MFQSNISTSWRTIQRLGNAIRHTQTFKSSKLFRLHLETELRSESRSNYLDCDKADGDLVEQVIEWMAEDEPFDTICVLLEHAAQTKQNGNSEDPYDSLYAMYGNQNLLEIPEDCSSTHSSQ